METCFKPVKYAAALVLVVMLNACGGADRKDRDDSADTVIDSISDTTQRAHAQTADVDLNGDEKIFVLAAATSGMMEIEAANLALKLSTNTKVKGFAKQMLTDHTKASVELAAIAKGKGIAVPTVLQEEKKLYLDKLKNLNDKKFNEQYITMMIADHATTVKLFTEGKALPDPQLKVFAEKHLPVITGHYNEAVKIGKEMNLTNAGNGDDLQGMSPEKGKTN